MNKLTERQQIILSLIVHEHTRTAQPVASKTLISDYNLKISSATVRNEMNVLTELGYLRQPHTSAGRVPTEDGYRFFVSNLMQHTALPVATRNTIAHQFYQSRKGLDHWLPLAASVLANRSRAVSIVTAPHSETVSFKHLELISTQASQVLMVLVLVGGEVQQQVISLEGVLSQEQLSQIAAQINHSCQNASLEQIQQLPKNPNPLVNQVLEAVVDQLNAASKLVAGELYLDGISNLLLEPEFLEARSDASPLRILEARPMLGDLIAKTVQTDEIGDIQVLIGGENIWQDLQNYALVLTRYGVPDQLSGAIGILGPMRMPYGEAISTVRYVAELMSDLVSDNLIN